MSLRNLAESSEEKRNQRIIKLQQGYNHLQYVTLKQAAQYFGYSELTVKKWAKDGNVPLIVDNKSTVVPFTDKNKPTQLPQAETPGDVMLQYLTKHHI